MMRMVQGLDRERFEHAVVCPQVTNGVLEELRRLPNVCVEPMNLRRFGPQHYWRLHRFLHEFRPHVIHSHGKAAGLYSRPLGRWSRTPVVHQHHGLHWKHYNGFGRKAYLELERRLSNWTDRIVCVSQSEAQETEELGLHSPSQVQVIPNGVDGERFRPDPLMREELRDYWGIPKHAWVLLSITRANVQKHLELTLEVHHEFRKIRPDCVLVLAGVTEAELQEFRERGTSCDRSHLIVTANEHRMHQLINIADCYLSTSRWEGLSVGLLEALAMDLPAVISEVTGNQDLSAFGPKGVVLVPQSDLRGYVNHLHTFSKATPQPHAREDILEHYGQAVHLKKIQQLYNEVSSPT